MLNMHNSLCLLFRWFWFTTEEKKNFVLDNFIFKNLQIVKKKDLIQKI